MGDAKRRRAEEERIRREAFRTGLEFWLFEPTAEEADIVAELDETDGVWASRLPAKDLLEAGINRGRCHDNADHFERLFGGEFVAVRGWAISAPLGDYVCHSVISDGDRWVCVTPTEDIDDKFIFLPDPALSDGDGVMLRNGKPIGSGVRRNAQATIALVTEYLNRLDRGDDLDVMLADLNALAEEDARPI